MAQTCLVAEQDPFLSALLERLLQENGLNVTRVRSGQELLAQARATLPLLVILDPELPGLTRGWEAARALHEDAALRGVPIICCSWRDAAEAAALLGIEVAGHLQKPDIHFEDVRALLQSAHIVPVPSSP